MSIDTIAEMVQTYRNGASTTHLRQRFDVSQGRQRSSDGSRVLSRRHDSGATWKAVRGIADAVRRALRRRGDLAEGWK
jgi:hypothetical protein